MLKPKSRPTRRHWENLSDDLLLDAELMTDDPESLENLVYEIPEGDEEPHVEFKYDLRKSEREMFSCVHGHHKHLAGFVMRKGDARFLVGWMCAETIYGEDFEQYTSDFDAAVNRQDALRRVREIKSAVTPFVAYLESVSQSEVFKHFARLRGQLREHMSWVYDNLPAAAVMNARIIGAALPKNLCAVGIDPRGEFNQIMSDVAATALVLARKPEEAAGMIGIVRSRFEALVRRTEVVFDTLREVEDFFQPNALAAICKLANEHDNPRRRIYECSLLSITCKRDKKNKTAITMPRSFVAPDRRPLEAFRIALAGMRV